MRQFASGPLLDVAFRGDAADPVALLSSLREVKGAEARFHEANMLLINGHPAEAFGTARGCRQRRLQRALLPAGVPARPVWVNSADLSGDRAGAVRAYRGVLAFDWVPEDAREAAVGGLEAPFAGIPE